MKAGSVHGAKEAAPAPKAHEADKGSLAASKEQTVQKLQELLEKLIDKIKKGDDAEKSGNASPADKKENAKDKELMELLEKLLKGDIKPEEMEKLSKQLGKMLGMKPEEMNDAKGAGTSNDV